jgi:hypothetical protein
MVRVTIDESLKNVLECRSKLHSMSGLKREGGLINGIKGVTHYQAWATIPLWYNTGGGET